MPNSSQTISQVQTDFLIIGGGVAGLRAAIEACRRGEVILLNKGLGNESNSEFAQGGIAAALEEDEDGMQSHFEDTIDAGRGLCRTEAVKILVEEGPRRIHELIGWGAEFDKIGPEFALAREGAHRQSRILRARGDATGYEIVRTLQRRVQNQKNISIRKGHFSIDLIMEGNVCRGAWALDEQEGTLIAFLAQQVILATGGAGQVYLRTTNPPVATGDGVAMALRAGAVIEDMEFFQFHPTSLSLPSAPSFLLSEAMRGEGARLRDADGKPFMDRYHPDAELAPRDLVTRAIWERTQQGKERNVFLDVTHLRPSFVRERFPRIYATCLQYGIDITQHPIPVAPSAHYLMGGVKTDLNGESTIERLWAVGEVACVGVHGANRLASNSLLEGLVFGARAGDAVGRTISTSLSPFNIGETPFHPDGCKRCSSPPLEQYLSVQKELKETMWNDVGIIRSKASLEKAIRKWREWEWVVAEFPCSALKPARLRFALETRNMLLVAAAIIEAARWREESLGAHFRDDFPRQEVKKPEHSYLTRTSLRKDFPSI